MRVPSPIAVFTLAADAERPMEWDTVQLVRWMVSGHIHIERGGLPLDVATVAAAQPQDLADAELHIYEPRVAALFRLMYRRP